MDTVEDNLHFNDMGLPNATKENWRESANLLIGEEEVAIVKARFDKAYPIVRISAMDPEAITRVLDAAIAYSDELDDV